MTDSQIVNLKISICILNTASGLFVLHVHNEFFARAIVGMLLVGLGPVAWNNWLHRELFSTKNGKLYITHRSFELIGLIAALGVLSMIVHSTFSVLMHT